MVAIAEPVRPGKHAGSASSFARGSARLYRRAPARPACAKRDPIGVIALGPRGVHSRGAATPSHKARGDRLVVKATSEVDEGKWCKETRRTYYRIQYGKSDWIKHRSSSRYWRHLIALFDSGAVRSIMMPMLAVMASATVAAVVNHFKSELPTLFTTIFKASEMAFSLTASMLALLLVFRTNTSSSPARADAHGVAPVVVGGSCGCSRSCRWSCGCSARAVVVDKCALCTLCRQRPSAACADVG